MNSRSATRFLSAAALLAVALLLLAGCAPSEEKDAGTPGEVKARKEAAVAASYPLETELTNSDGKVIKVTITGRTQKEVIFTRDGDDKETSYPLSKLARDDRRRVGAMPIGTAPPPEAPYVASRKKAIEDIRRRIKEAEAEIKGPSIINTTANVEAKRKKIEGLRKEMALLEQQIQDYSGQ